MALLNRCMPSAARFTTHDPLCVLPLCRPVQMPGPIILCLQAALCPCKASINRCMTSSADFFLKPTGPRTKPCLVLVNCDAWPALHRHTQSHPVPCLSIIVVARSCTIYVAKPRPLVRPARGNLYGTLRLIRSFSLLQVFLWIKCPFESSITLNQVFL